MTEIISSLLKGKSKMPACLLAGATLIAFDVQQTAPSSLASEIQTPVIPEKFHYKVVDGKLSVFGYLLEPRFPIKASSPPEEDDTLIGVNRSPSGRWMLIKAGLRLETDLWLYDSHKKDRPVKVHFKPRGRHIFTEWHSNDVFEIQHAGMGYSQSDLFRADDLTEKTSIDGLIYLLDLQKNLYVSYFMDKRLVTGVELGRIFAGKTKKERFPLKLDVEYLSDAMFAIEKVDIVGDKLIVTHRKRDDTLVQEEFSPRELKE